MCEQYAGGLVGFHPQVAVLGFLAFAYLAEPTRLGKGVATEATSALSAGEVFKHIGSDIGVDIFYRVEKQSVHGVILTLSAI